MHGKYKFHSLQSVYSCSRGGCLALIPFLGVVSSTLCELLCKYISSLYLASDSCQLACVDVNHEAAIAKCLL